MIELVYPPEPAPLSDKAAKDHAEEMLPVVELDGLVVAQASRQYCHENGLLHPVVHLHIIDRFSRIFLQLRSHNKEYYPDCWDTAVGGHLSYGEYSLETLYREAAEELGPFDFNAWQIHDYIFTSDDEKELVIVYGTVGHFNLKPDNYEVSGGRYWKIEEIEASMGKGVFTPEFETEFPIIKDKLLAML